ncbi:hypothetical protein KPL39_02095 [Clostridium gasigenes]|uniref:hypothetical protein n=1 Tax=Clostridium gasigenes TaxID=94869 RepID=UPI001C0C5D9B|nr:hypothetical protein [Clostridium gasigenes]MBU3135052.1 hypothetical protein [Clostridium gasigenes]
MKVKELVNLLNLQEVTPFKFCDYKDDGEFAKFVYISDVEYKDLIEVFDQRPDYINKYDMLDEYIIDYMNLKGKSYTNDNIEIRFADVTVDELFILMKNMSDRDRCKTIFKIVRNSCYPLNEDELKYAVAIFTILHELGHSIYFSKSNKNVLEYSLWESGYRRKFGNGVVGTYSEIPSEKWSDDYASEKLDENLDKVREYLSILVK